MGKRNGILLTVLVLVFLVTPSWAAIKPDSLSVTGFCGGYFFDGAEHLETSPVIGLKLGYDFAKNFGLELDLEGLRTKAESDYRTTMFDDKLNVGSVRIDGLYYFMPDNDLVPYFTAGVGMTHYSTHDGENYNYNSVVTWGLGLKYFLSERFALRGEARHLIIIEPDFRYRATGERAIDDTYLNNFEVILGLTYVFGGKECPAPCPPPVVVPVPAPAPPKLVPTAMEREILEKGRATLDVKFEFDKADILPQYHDELATFANILKKYPELVFELAGHTDDVGRASYNLKLSQRRVDSVKSYLVEHFNVDPQRIVAIGYGMTQPIATNDTAEGRQQNRRVEAVVNYTYKVKVKETLKQEYEY